MEYTEKERWHDAGIMIDDALSLVMQECGNDRTEVDILADLIKLVGDLHEKIYVDKFGEITS